MADAAQMEWRVASPGDPEAAAPDGGRTNGLLLALPEDLKAAIDRSSRPKEFAAGEWLREPGKPLHHVYFIRSGIVSICGGEPEAQVEVVSVGSEGLIGVSNILGAPAAGHAAIAVAPCVVDSIDAPVLGMLMAERPELSRAMAAYAHARMEQIIRLSVCNVRHRLEQRLARWIEAAHERVGPERIVVTHKDLARLLGVRRASVTEAMHLVEGHGAIRSHRGYVSVRDADKLKELSCGCHRPPGAVAAG